MACRRIGNLACVVGVSSSATDLKVESSVEVYNLDTNVWTDGFPYAKLYENPKVHNFPPNEDKEVVLQRTTRDRCDSYQNIVFQGTFKLKSERKLVSAHRNDVSPAYLVAFEHEQSLDQKVISVKKVEESSVRWTFVLVPLGKEFISSLCRLLCYLLVIIKYTK